MDKTEIKSLADQALLFDLMGTLVSCGCPILDVFEDLKEAFPKYRHIMESVHNTVGEGGSIYDSLNTFEEIHPFAKSMILVGESTGSLDVVLNKISNHFKFEVEMKSKGIDNERLQEITFYRSLATYIDAGIPLVQTLTQMKSCCEYPPRIVLDDILAGVVKGSWLADVMKTHGEYFPSYIVSLVSAGENGGILDTTLNRLCAYLERKLSSGSFSE